MARKITAQYAFDEVMGVVGVLAQLSMDEQEAGAVERLKTLIQKIVDIEAR